MSEVSFILIIIMLAVGVISLFFLPEQFAVQWNSNGVSGTAVKWIVFAFPALALIVNVVSNTSSNNQTRKQHTAILLLCSIILFACQILITCNALGFIEITKIDGQFAGKICCILAGCILTYAGNKLPKFARNYYIGIKTSWAYESNDIWTKVQRFGGKVWVISGIAILLASFAPLKIQSIVLVVCILMIGLLPRIYGMRLYQKTMNGNEK